MRIYHCTSLFHIVIGTYDFVSRWTYIIEMAIATHPAFNPLSIIFHRSPICISCVWRYFMSEVGIIHLWSIKVL